MIKYIRRCNYYNQYKLKQGFLQFSSLPFFSTFTTIVYCGLGEVDEDVALFGRKLKTGCRIVSLFLPFVGILPAAADYPFYLMKVPFRKTKDISLWTSKVLFTGASVEELYQELDTDREYRYDKRTFKRMMKERFPSL